jgi:LacI family transcriptional regulator
MGQMKESRVSVTIADVALKAGVSIKTVSRVVNNEPHVREGVRARVREAMRDLGYSPNIAARRLASNSAFAICLLFGGAPGEYFPQIILSILSQGARRGYTLLVADFTPYDDASRTSILDLVTRKHADGLILTPPCDNDTDLLEALRARGVPFVRLTPADPQSPLPFVSAEDGRGAYDMASYLVGLGHRRIAYVHGDPQHHASQERFEGFRSALRDCGVPYDDALARPGDFRFDRGIEAGLSLLEREDRPTAIFAANDESAAGVLVAAHTLGIRVPADVSVAGFDDFPSARKTYPALSTVRQNLEEISGRATQLLFELIQGRAPGALHVRVPTELVIRESTGPCPR